MTRAWRHRIFLAMAEPLIDLSTIDLEKVVMTRDDVYRILPQRCQFEVIGGIVHFDVPSQGVVSYCDFGTDDWWVPGHLPGRPIVPGIILMEAAAQTAALMMREIAPGWRDRFIGFGGMDGIRFRGVITPPARVWMVARGATYRSSLARVPVQGFHDGKIIFSGEVLGVLL